MTSSSARAFTLERTVASSLATSLTLVSTVTTNARTRDPEVQRLAGRVVAAFEATYPALPTLA